MGRRAWGVSLPIPETASARHWAEYEAGLRERGDLTVWLSDKALDAWRAAPSGNPGGQRASPSSPGGPTLQGIQYPIPGVVS